ncbi:MAG TPA: Gfo/Idh/MocA family oxidoreductase [Vicinamibacterales bacterium]|jgi:predicted dehydrogenase|nr:Gfo/Idh/MocA family oxidoreductase [Vicinamibacterales bacterium]
MRRLRWGVIGAGDIVRRRVAPALRDSPDCDFVAITRARADRAGEATALGARRWYASWRDLVTDAEVDAVYVATPVYLHAEQTVAAAVAGKHVLCEKPMAMNAGECDRMVAACRANRVKLGVAYYRHFYPVVKRVKDVMASGEIGHPVFAQMSAFEWFDPGPDHPRRWLLNPSISGGGPMIDFGCHRLEVLVHLFGPVDRTAAVTANVVFKREVEDTAAVLLHFIKGPCASLAVTHCVRDKQDTLRVFGTRGSIRAADLNSGTLVVSADGAERTESHPPADNVHRPLIDDFVDAVAGNREPSVDGALGRAVSAIMDDIYADSPPIR